VTPTDDTITKAMRDAVAAYTAPVTQCPPGKSRGRRIKAKSKAKSKTTQWLIEHRDDLAVADPKAQRRRLRKRHAQQQRFAERNAPLLDRIRTQQRRAERDSALIEELNKRERC
jgi:hypothetical protein